MPSADCKDYLLKLESYADSELDASSAAAVLSHVTGCKKCREALRQAEHLSRSLRQSVTRHEMPPGLSEKILFAVRQEAAPPRRPARLNTAVWMGWFVPAFSTTALALSLTLFLSTPSADDMLADEVIAGHVRALMEQHITDVVSSDQHTVKPWFAGKIDFTLPVHDFADQGFPLAGGRLDYMQRRDTAALVYRHNKHVINIFVAPSAPDAADIPLRRLTRRGYNLILWRKDHLSFEAVSDMNGDDLETLCRLISR